MGESFTFSIPMGIEPRRLPPPPLLLEPASVPLSVEPASPPLPLEPAPPLLELVPLSLLLPPSGGDELDLEAGELAVPLHAELDAIPTTMATTDRGAAA